VIFATFRRRRRRHRERAGSPLDCGGRQFEPQARELRSPSSIGVTIGPS